MHWRLTKTGSLSLRQTIRKSSWILHAPFHTTHLGHQLLRIERINSQKTISVVIAENNRNIVLHSSSNLTGPEIETVTWRVRRMLRLGDDFQPFINLIRSYPINTTQDITSPAIIRGGSLFEDIIRAATYIWNESGSINASNFTWLVDHFGDPLPSNPTLHAFPEPDQILSNPESVITQIIPATSDTIIHIATLFAQQAPTIQAILEKELPSLELSKVLQNLLQLEDAPLSHVMLSLGRYDYIPSDTFAKQRWHQYVRISTQPLIHDIQQHFASWQPWGGLAYWLWDWQPVTEMNMLQSQ
ncbi:MAG: hypothetical protein P1S60_16200 [Anaerolineae bacterium]|nr:hypothetical protein [Anaerolineae bacterium]